MHATVKIDTKKVAREELTFCMELARELSIFSISCHVTSV